MAECDNALRRQCQDLLTRLKLHQCELKVMIPSSTSSLLEPSTNFWDHRNDLKPEYARDKLRSVVKSMDNAKPAESRREFSSLYTNQTSSSSEERPVSVSTAWLDPCEDSYSGYHGNERERSTADRLQAHQDIDVIPTSYTTDENVGSRPDYSSRYMTTPKTRRKRELIDRNVRVANRLDTSRDIDTSDHLNFSYSHIGDDDMTFLKSALQQSPEEIFQDVASSRVNDDWRGEVAGNMSQENRWEDMHVPVTRYQGADRSFEQGPERSEVTGSSVPSAAFDSEVTYAKQLVDEGNNKQMANFVKETQIRPRSILANNDTTLTSRNKNSSKVSFRSFGNSSSVIQRESEKKMLGYDWIAALLDNDKAVIEESEAFFEDLKEFRRINRDECSNQVYMEGPLALSESREPSPVAKAISDTKVKPYMVNERLFPVPIKKSLLSEFEGPNEEEKETPKREPTYEEPRFVRVSIPRSTLESPHRFKPHRRRSFDPTDSCGLMEHCLLGWENSRPAMIPTASNVGISEATTGISSKMATTLADAERLAKSYEWAFPQATTHRPDLFPSWRKNYQDSVINLSTINATRPPQTSSLPTESESLRKSTTDLLNSTYSMMYEMERLKQERTRDPHMQTKGVA